MCWRLWCGRNRERDSGGALTERSISSQYDRPPVRALYIRQVRHLRTLLKTHSLSSLSHAIAPSRCPVRLWFWLTLGATLLLFTAAGANAEPKRVLLLHSFGRDFSPWSDVARSLRMEIQRQSPDVTEFFDASLLTERLGPDQDEAPFVDYLRALFANRRLDLIVTIGAPAARFVQKYRAQLFPSTPMLFTGVEQRRVPLTSLTANDTVVSITYDFDAVINNILRLLPRTTEIAVVTGDSPVEQYWLEQMRGELQPHAHRVRFTFFNDLSFDEMLKRAAVLPPQSAIFFFLLSVDAAGVFHEDATSLGILRAAANAPVFSHLDVNFGEGIVGGPLISIQELTKRAASVATRMLGGEAASGIKMPSLTPGTPKYDWRELQRWNINETLLPDESQVHFRLPGMWDEYRWQMISAVAVGLLQSLMILALFIQYRRKQRIELESRSRFLEVLHLNRTAMAAAMSSSITHELNQPLAAILSNTEAAETLLHAHTGFDDIREILSDIRDADNHAAAIIRRQRELLKKKNEVDVKEFDLNDAVRAALHILRPEVAKRKIVARTLYVNSALPVRADQIHLQQVTINIVANALDAMQSVAEGSRTLTVRTAFAHNSTAEVSISDSGPGISPDDLTHIFDSFYTTKKHGTGLGLSLSRSIVETHGGRLWAENTRTGGAVFRFTLPLAADAAHKEISTSVG